MNSQVGKFLLLLLFSSIFIYSQGPRSPQEEKGAKLSVQTGLRCPIFGTTAGGARQRNLGGEGLRNAAQRTASSPPVSLGGRGKSLRGCRGTGGTWRSPARPPASTRPLPARSGAAGRQPPAPAPAPAVALPIQNPQHHLLGSGSSALSSCTARLGPGMKGLETPKVTWKCRGGGSRPKMDAGSMGKGMVMPLVYF